MNRGTDKKFSALAYLQRLRKPDFFVSQLNITGPEAWVDPKLQYETLEHRVAILAWRHLEDTKRGRDTSYDVLELTMAHSDLNYWRGLQAQLEKVPQSAIEAMRALAQVVSISLPVMYIINM